MIAWLAKQLRYLFGFLRTNDSPRQIAMGFALGVVLGLTPKGNLLAVFMASLLFSLRVNISAGMLSALIVSFGAHLCDPVSDAIGHWLLSAPALRPFWTRLYNLPVVPWSGFNNTLILGSFVLGWLLVYPTFRATLPPITRWQKYQAARKQARAAALKAADESLNGATISISSPEAAVARERLRRQRFRQFLAEVESISQYRGAA